MNTFGHLLRLTTAGESHGPALVGILDGFPAGLIPDLDGVQRFMSYRAPGADPKTGSPRKEPDRVKFLSGIYEGVTTGTPIAFMIENEDARSEDYEYLSNAYRPSHADFTYQMKYGLRDHRGGGRASARETALRVAAGALALGALNHKGVRVMAYTSQIGGVKLHASPMDLEPATDCYRYSMRCPDPTVNARMEALVRRVREAGDTVGGVVTCIVHGLPAGVGEPVYDKLQAMLASAMMSINAAKGFEYGMGFEGAGRLGSETLDYFVPDGRGGIATATNHSGGIQGGISNGNLVYFRTAFKPIATLMRDLPGINAQGQPVTLPSRGRHDACAVVRAVPVVQAMTALTVMDAMMMAGASAW